MSLYPDKRFLFVALGLVFAMEWPCAGLCAGRFVSLSGVDSNSGSYAQPWRTVGISIARLSPGDTLYLRGGKYFESVTAAVSGTAAARIMIRSYPGEQAILDSGYPEFETPGNTEWELVDAVTGEYRSSRSYTFTRIYGYLVPHSPYENGLVALVPYVSLAHFRANTEVYNPSAFYVGPGTADVGDGRIHIRLAKTTDLIAAETRYGTVLESPLPNPGDYALYLSSATRTLWVTGSYLTFEGIVFHQALNTIDLGENVHDLRFENITAWNGDRAIEAAHPGIHDITLIRSRFFGDCPYWVFWSDMKNAPYPATKLRGTSIDLRAGTHDWEIAHCHVRGCGQDLLSTNEAEYNLRIHHNRFENAGDEALELEGSLGHTEVYENFFLNCLAAVASGQESPGFTGPLYVYRNVVAQLRNPPVNRAPGINTWNGGGRFGYEYALKQNAADNSTRDAHYYHNTFLLLNSGFRGVNLTPRYPDGTRTANNLVVKVNGVVTGQYMLGADEVVDGNLYWKMNTVDTSHLVWSYDQLPALYAATMLEAHGVGNTSKRGTDPGFANLPVQIVDRSATIWELPTPSERVTPSAFLLGATSPARGAGIVIPPHAVHGPLPDTRSSRDIGAIPYGTPASEYAGFPFDPYAPSGPQLVDVPPPAPRDGLTLRAFPNPASRHAEVRFSLPREGPVRLDLLDLGGRVVRTLLDSPALAAGEHRLAIDAGSGAGSLRAGLYFYRLVTHDSAARGRLVLIP